MLEDIVKKTGLTLGGLDHGESDLKSANPFAQDQNITSEVSNDSGGRLDSACRVFDGDHAFSNDASLAWTSFPSPGRTAMAYADVMYGRTVADQVSEQCFNETWADNVLGFGGMHAWAKFV